MSLGKGIWSCFLVMVLGVLAVVATIAIAWGVVLLMQRGSGSHLPDPDVPSMSITREPLGTGYEDAP